MNKNIREGIDSGIPVALGYIPIAMTFGVLSKTAQISLGESLLFSSVVYAGASQFMALNMIMLGSGFIQIVLATFLINFRHFLMSASLSQRMTIRDTRLIPFISFGVTDESFSLASARRDEITPAFFLSLHLTVYSAWVGGTFLGYLIGEILPENLSASMVIGLYAMFTSLLVPQMKRSMRISFLVILSGVINTLLRMTSLVPRGWDIVTTITIVSLIGVFTEKEDDTLEL